VALVSNTRLATLVKTILVTGAGGYLGRELVRQLLALGTFHVRAQVRGSRLDSSFAQHPRLEQLHGDLSNQHFCASLCRGVDTIIHLANRAHTVGTKDAQWAASFVPTQYLADAAVSAGVQKLIFLSSIKANDPEQSPYAAVKRQQEDELLRRHQSGQLRVVCLRPALIYGPGMRGNLATLFKLLRRPNWRILPRPSGEMGLIGLEDCCRAIIAGLELEALEGQRWQLDDGNRYTVIDIFREVRRSLGLSPLLLWIPRPLVFCATMLSEWSAPLTGLSIGRGSYATLYLERFQPDPSYGQLCGFVPRQEFYREIPVLLENMNA